MLVFVLFLGKLVHSVAVCCRTTGVAIVVVERGYLKETHA